ncbi:MAG TPA: hypothetical protein VFG00_04080 [Acidothermaceae bacterium]|nr:hypothetical protein [Acidothermaceae bacterium]
MIEANENRRRRGLLVGCGSVLASAAAVIVVVMGVGTHRTESAALPVPSAPPSVQASVQQSMPPPLPSFDPPAIQTPVDGHIGAMYATQILTYTPYVNDLPRPGLVIASTDSSMVSPIDPSLNCTAVAHDLEPLRCLSPNGPIYDPCFPNLEGSSCLFVASPAATKAVRVLLGPPTPTQPPQPAASPNSWPGYGIANPWALDLTDGTECVFSHGAEDNVNGLRPNYACSDGRYVFGNPDETLSGWSVQLGASIRGPLTDQIGITSAWLFGNR